MTKPPAKKKAAGYSGTPLSKKLGIEAGNHVLLIEAPEEWGELVAPLPHGIVFDPRVISATDIVHLFVTRRSELARRLKSLRKELRPDAAVWVSWPKKSAGVETDITEDVIREIALPMGWVDIKVCAVSEVWSGLKLVIRKELRST
jgi:hypothetical protein